MTKRKQLMTLLIVALLALLVSGCRGTGAVAAGWPGITIAENTAYVAYNQGVYSLDLADEGDLIASYPEEAIRGATFFHEPVLLDEETILVGGYNNTIYTIDLDDGSSAEFFDSAKNRWIGAPLMVEDTLYAPNSNGILYALDLDGEIIWEFETEAAIWATPVFADGRLYVASQDHHLYAVNANTGDLIWDLDLGASAVSSPVIDEDGTLYIGTFGSQLFAVDSESGTALWAVETEDWIWGSPQIGSDGMIFVTDFGANLYAVDTTTKSILWDKQVDAGSSITGSALLYDDALFVATRSGVIASYDLQGERLWKEELGEENGEFYGTPVVTNDGTILIGAVGAENIIYAYDTNLEPLWQFMPEN